MGGERSTSERIEIDFWIFCHACNCAFRPEFFGAVFWIDDRGFEVDVEVEVEAAQYRVLSVDAKISHGATLNPDPDPDRP